MSALAPTAGVPPTPAVTPPTAGIAPVAAIPPVVGATPPAPVVATPPVVDPTPPAPVIATPPAPVIATPPAPVVATPPVVAPTPPAPVIATPPAPVIATPPAPVVVPPVASPPAPVLVPPPPAPAIPPTVVPPPPAPAIPPTVVPPPPAPVETTPPVVSPPPPVIGSPPEVSPPPPVIAPPPDVSPPPPVDGPPPAGSPPPPATSPPPPSARVPPPPSTVISPPVANKSPPPPAINSPPAASGPTSKSSSISTAVIGGIAAGGGLLALALLVFLFFFCKRRKNKKNVLPYAVAGGAGGGGGGGAAATGAAYKAGGMDGLKGYAAGGNSRLPPGSYGGAVPLPPEGSPSVGNSRSWFTYEELETATNGFAQENLLGEGGFGRVYKGELPTGQVVAVKQLTIGGGQGDREFRAEVEIISRVHHRHLVSLVGYCIADKQRLLVYDFVPNGTLDVNLYGKGKPIMNWEMRVRVALGAARGLAYLHEDCHPRIIHRDIKSSNILLDDKYEAQVADFGLAKLASDTHTHVSTRVMGTFGYLAPEYAQSGKLTEKSDVYSFGVMLLELVTGRKPIDQRNPVGQESLVEWSRPLLTYALEDGDLDELVDPRLDGDYDSKEMLRVIEVAASCVRHTAAKRPKMGQVVRALESEEENDGLYTTVKPGHSSEHESDFDRYAGSDYDTQAYNADMLRSRKTGMGTKSYGSEYTSEYTSGQMQSDRGSSTEFDPIIPKPGETHTKFKELAPTSVRTGRSAVQSMRTGRSMESYTSLPPTRAAPPRPGPSADSDRSGSIRSDMFVPPPPPPDYSQEYNPIEFNSGLRDGR